MFDKKTATVILISILLISVFCIPAIQNIYFDYNYEKFFPQEDENVKVYNKFKKDFVQENSFLLVGLSDAQGVFNRSFLARVDSLTKTLASLTNVVHVTSPTNLKYPILTISGLVEVNYISDISKNDFYIDSARLMRDPLIRGAIISEDAKAITLAVEFKLPKERHERDAFLYAIEDSLSNYKFDEVHLSGQVKGQNYFTQVIQSEMVLFSTLTIVILFIFLSFGFRSFWGVIIPMLIVFLTVYLLFSFLGGLGIPISLVLALVPALVFVVGISDTIHILEKYIEDRRGGMAVKEALASTLKIVGVTTFLTTLTTAVGFLSLYSSPIQPIKEFGLFTFIGVFLAFILTVILVPCLIILCKPFKKLESKHTKDYWGDLLAKCFPSIIRNRIRITIGTVLLIIISGFGINNISTNMQLMDDWRDSNPHKQDYLFFENNFEGFKPFELIVERKDSSKSLLDLDIIPRLIKIDSGVKEIYKINQLISPITLLKSANRMRNGGKQEFFTVPQDSINHNIVIEMVHTNLDEERLRSIISADGHLARFTGKMKDFGTVKGGHLNQQFEQFIKGEEFKELKISLTGIGYLVDQNNTFIAQSLIRSLGIAMGVIALILLVYLRSWKLWVIGVIPNLVPLFILGGVMGFVGIPLNISTAIIFSISLGIATDDTIHLMARIKLELSKGSSPLKALRISYIGTGKAIIITTLILACGFSVFTLSEITSTFYIGALITLTLVAALLADLIILPALFLFFYPNRNEKH